MPVMIDLAPSFEIEVLTESFERYKVNKTDRFTGRVRVPQGADGVSWKDFEKNLQRNVNGISRRVMTGNYMFFPLRQFAIHKIEVDARGTKQRWRPLNEGWSPNTSSNIDDHPCPDGYRILSIARIRDVIVQKQLYRALLPAAEKVFTEAGVDQVSFAYRPRKSVADAASKVKSAYRDGYSWVFEADIKKFFDRLNHERLFCLIDDWIGLDSLAGNLLRRYARTPMVPFDSYMPRHEFGNGQPITRCAPVMGIPQGGVLSGLLANLYLNEFDLWVTRDLGRTFDLKYVRYADDFVILTRGRSDAEAVYEPIKEKIASLELEIHDIDDPKRKTAVRSIRNEGFSFIGFRYRGNMVRPKPKSIRNLLLRIEAALHNEITYKGRFQSPQARLTRAVTRFVNPKLEGPQPDLCAVCCRPTDRRRNWISFYAPVVTDWKAIRGVDTAIRREIIQYFLKEHGYQFTRSDLKNAKLKNMVRMSRRIRSVNDEICRCPLPAPVSSTKLLALQNDDTSQVSSSIDGQEGTSPASRDDCRI